MSLADHWSEGDWLPEGWHLTRVVGCEDPKFNSGNPGIKFILEGIEQKNRGKQRDIAFSLLDQSLWKLARFARECGMSEQEARAYDTNSMASHRTLINRTIMVLVEKGEKYHEITEFCKPEEAPPVDNRPSNPAVDRSQQTEEAVYADAHANSASRNVPF